MHASNEPRSENLIAYRQDSLTCLKLLNEAASRSQVTQHLQISRHSSSAMAASGASMQLGAAQPLPRHHRHHSAVHHHGRNSTFGCRKTPKMTRASASPSQHGPDQGTPAAQQSGGRPPLVRQTPLVIASFKFFLRSHPCVITHSGPYPGDGTPVKVPRCKMLPENSASHSKQAGPPNPPRRAAMTDAAPRPI